MIHNGVQRVLENGGAKVEAHTRHEPSATELLRGRYTPGPEDCRALFLSNQTASKENIKRSKTLQGDLDDAIDGPDGEARVEALAVARRKLAQLAEDVFNKAREGGRPVDKWGAGVRPDIAIGHAGGDIAAMETWIDVTSTNLLSHQYATPTFIQRQKLEEHARDPKPVAPNRVPRALRNCETMKRLKYKHLMETAQEHLAGEMGVQCWAFAFLLQATLGPEVEEVIKGLKEAYGRRLERDPAPRDGESTKHRMMVFEKELRDEIAVAIARGLGEMQMSAGWAGAHTGRCRRANEIARAGG